MGLRRCARCEPVGQGDRDAGHGPLDFVDRVAFTLALRAWCAGASLVLGEPQVEATVARVEPAARHDFPAGEEVHAFGAVGVGVTNSELFQPPKE